MNHLRLATEVANRAFVALLTALLCACTSPAAPTASSAVTTIQTPATTPSTPPPASGPSSSTTSAVTTTSPAGQVSWHELPVVANVQAGTGVLETTDRTDGLDTLSILCLEGRYVAVSIIWAKTTLGDHQFPELTTTVGTAAPTTKPWPTMATPNVTYYSSDSAETVAFVRSLFGQTTLAARVSLPDGGSKSATWNITGTEDAVVSVRRVCEW